MYVLKFIYLHLKTTYDITIFRILQFFFKFIK